jgi:hypothetical protein
MIQNASRVSNRLRLAVKFSLRPQETLSPSSKGDRAKFLSHLLTWARMEIFCVISLRLLFQVEYLSLLSCVDVRLGTPCGDEALGLFNKAWLALPFGVARLFVGEKNLKESQIFTSQFATVKIYRLCPTSPSRHPTKILKVSYTCSDALINAKNN